MAASTLRVGIEGLDKIDDLTRSLALADEEIPDELKNSVRESASILGGRAQLRVMMEPSLGAKHTGLRARVARGVGLRELNSGYRITTSMPVPDEAAIPRGMDQHGWRHPVFGDQSVWVRQGVNDFSWFMDTMQEAVEVTEPGLNQVLEDAADRIARSVRT